MEQSPPAIRQIAVRERLEYTRLDVAAEVLRRDAHEQFDFERNVARRIELEIVPGHPVALDAGGQFVFERLIELASSERIDGHEHRVPAAGPAQRRRGALHGRMPPR